MSVLSFSIKFHHHLKSNSKMRLRQGRSAPTTCPPPCAAPPRFRRSTLHRPAPDPAAAGPPAPASRFPLLPGHSELDSSDRPSTSSPPRVGPPPRFRRSTATRYQSSPCLLPAPTRGAPQSPRELQSPASSYPNRKHRSPSSGDTQHRRRGMLASIATTTVGGGAAVARRPQTARRAGAATSPIPTAAATGEPGEARFCSTCACAVAFLLGTASPDEVTGFVRGLVVDPFCSAARCSLSCCCCSTCARAVASSATRWQVR